MKTLDWYITSDGSTIPKQEPHFVKCAVTGVYLFLETSVQDYPKLVYFAAFSLTVQTCNNPIQQISYVFLVLVDSKMSQEHTLVHQDHTRDVGPHKFRPVQQIQYSKICPSLSQDPPRFNGWC